MDEYVTSDHLDSQGEYELLRTELTEAKDRVLRAQAELENYRRRSQREMQDTLRYAELPLLRDLLPVVDDIQRAIQAAEKSPENGGLLEGFRMVESHDCKRIAALDQPFDPNLHQAIAQQPSADKPAGTVTLVAQDGYTLHDRVVRPAQVIVSS
jgi:molecular chaperone GrpE